jgi:hypothetical protein
MISRTAVGGLLVGAACLVAGCDPAPPADESDQRTTSPAPLASAECVPLEHEGRKLGVTVPAGFAVNTPPDGAEEIRDTYEVNLLSLANRPEAGRALPVAALAVYGYGTDEREGQSALEASVLNFKKLTGGINQGNPIAATPTTVAGAPGSAGGHADSRALDYNAPDDVDSTLRWWTVSVDGGLFVVTLATATPELDQQYAADIPANLKTGGC